jgi:pullulanase/glycogen debranching enzyme
LSRWAAVDDEAEGEEAASGDSPAVLLLINAGDEPVHFQLPGHAGDGPPWRVRIDTRTASGFPTQGDAPLAGGWTASGRSLVLLTQDAATAPDSEHAAGHAAEDA